MNLKPIIQYLSKNRSNVQKLSKIFPLKDIFRYENNVGKLAGSVSRKINNPYINKESLINLQPHLEFNKKFPKGNLFTGETIEKFIKDNLNPEHVRIPLRSKNPAVDVISKEMLQSRNDIKNLIQSKFYRRLLRKKGINEKDYIQSIENNLDELQNYVLVTPKEKYIYGWAGPEHTVLNPYSGEGAKGFTYLHEATHGSSQFGTKKNLHKDWEFSPTSVQSQVRANNDKLMSKYEQKLSQYALMHGMNPEYFKELSEIQANIRPIQMIMVENGWQPKQMSRLIKSYGINNQIEEYGKELVKALGKDGLADVLANMLKKGGKIPARRSNIKITN